MGKLSDAIKKLVRRPGDTKYHMAGFEYSDPTPIEVPLKLLQRHQDAQAYIRAYVQSEVRLAQLHAEHETVEDAFDFDVDDPEMSHEKTAAELEAEDLATMAQDSYDLRRIKQMVDRDRKFKAMRRPPKEDKGSAATVADVDVNQAAPVNPKSAPTNSAPSS